jgi:hypothetical protein
LAQLIALVIPIPYILLGVRGGTKFGVDALG